MNLWITAGGTGSAWHIANIVREYFGDKVKIFISDINEKDEVAASTVADYFFKVPRSDEEGYAEYMYKLLKENDIDVIIPLIPWEQNYFAADNEAFAKLGIRTAAASLRADNAINNKQGVYDFCTAQNIPTIKIYSKGEIEPDKVYFIKPNNGFGAAGARKILGKDITDNDWDTNVIEEYCGRIADDPDTGREITVEVFNAKGSIKTIARMRIEAKAGVCTKARILNVPEVDEVIKKFIEAYDMPEVFNIQFIYHEGKWKVMDVNLRLAAGTGISNAAGFQLIRAYISYLLGEPIDEEWFKIKDDIVTILRVYKEVIVR